MSEIDDLPDYEEDIITHDKLKKTIYKKPKKLPHYIIVGHGEVRETSTFKNTYNVILNYFCTRGNVMLGFIDKRDNLIEQMNKLCKKKIISKEILNYGEEIDNTEYSVSNENERKMFGIYSCDNLDYPIYSFDVGRIYTLEELLNYISNITIKIYNTNFFEVSIMGCRNIEGKTYIEPEEVYM